MTEPDFEDLLAEYAAPAADDGFTSAVMRNLPPALPDLAPEPSRWRYGLVALALGAAAGLAWRVSSAPVLDLLSRSDLAQTSPYLLGGAVAAFALCAWALFEVEAA